MVKGRALVSLHVDLDSGYTSIPDDVGNGDGVVGDDDGRKCGR